MLLLASKHNNVLLKHFSKAFCSWMAASLSFYFPLVNSTQLLECGQLLQLLLAQLLSKTSMEALAAKDGTQV